MSADENLSRPQFFHGTVYEIPDGDMVRTRAGPASRGWLKHNYFTESRDVAAENAWPGGFIHTVEPTGPYETDPAEPRSWKSKDPLRIVSTERLDPDSPQPTARWD